MNYLKYFLLILIVPFLGSCCNVYISYYNLYNEDEIRKYEYWTLEFTQVQSDCSKNIDETEKIFRPLYSPIAFQMKEDIFFELMDYYHVKMLKKTGPEAGVIKIHPVFFPNSNQISMLDIRLDSPDGRILARLKLENKRCENVNFTEQAAEKISMLIKNIAIE